MRFLLIVCVLLAAACDRSYFHVREPLQVSLRPGRQNAAQGTALVILAKRGWKFDESGWREVRTTWRRFYIYPDDWRNTEEIQLRITLKILPTSISAIAECTRRPMFNWRTRKERWIFYPCHRDEANLVQHSAEDLLQRLSQL